MYIYYIDDVMFSDVAFQTKIKARFIDLLRHRRVKLILVSHSGQHNEEWEKFRKIYANISFLRSPALFDVDGICGQLHSTYLAIDGYPPMQAYSGTCVEYDLKRKTCQRIYLDMFPDHAPAKESFEERLERMLRRELAERKGKTIFS